MKSMKKSKRKETVADVVAMSVGLLLSKTTTEAALMAANLKLRLRAEAAEKRADGFWDDLEIAIERYERAEIACAKLKELLNVRPDK